MLSENVGVRDEHGDASAVLSEVGVNLGEQLVRSEGIAQTPRDAYSEAPRGAKEAPETIELDSSSDSGTAG